MDLIVIEEIDEKGNCSTIGVCESMDFAKNMLFDYYEDYKILNIHDVRDSGLEYIYKIEFSNEILTIIFRNYELNKC